MDCANPIFIRRCVKSQNGKSNGINSSRSAFRGDSLIGPYRLASAHRQRKEDSCEIDEEMRASLAALG
jgi:hypothetical protein